MDSLVTSLTGGITSAATSALGALGTIVPAILPVVAGIAVVTLGVGVFRRFMK